MKKIGWQSKLIILATLALGLLIVGYALYISELPTLLVLILSSVKNQLQTHIAQSDQLNGYHEECYQSHLVEKYELRDYLSCRITISEEYMVGGLIRLIYSGGEDCPQNISFNSHKIISTTSNDEVRELYYPVKPYIYYWNETICDKNILVKDLG